MLLETLRGSIPKEGSVYRRTDLQTLLGSIRLRFRITPSRLWLHQCPLHKASGHNRCLGAPLVPSSAGSSFPGTQVPALGDNAVGLTDSLQLMGAAVGVVWITLRLSALSTEGLWVWITVPWGRCHPSLLWVLSAGCPVLSHPENNRGWGMSSIWGKLQPLEFLTAAWREVSPKQSLKLHPAQLTPRA